MNEHCNLFKFSLTQGELLLCEKIFNADDFNPHTRYSVDIRNILRYAITTLQKTLSKRNYSHDFNVGKANLDDSNERSYDLYGYYNNLLKLYPKYIRKDFEYNPQSIEQEIDDKVIRGVECKIGFYINNKPIVERTFYVDGFNPNARWSLELVNTVIYITDVIKEQIIDEDKKNMFDDYYLINTKGFNINQIREFSSNKRREMLKDIN